MECFPRPTRTIQRKNRAIETLASSLGKVGSEMYTTNQTIDYHIVVCCRWDPTDLKAIHEFMRCHEENCQGRNYCSTCFTIYAGPFGLRGSARVAHEKGCLPECEFQSMLTWLSDPIHRSVSSIDKYGFRYSGYNTEQRGFSAADCAAMSKYLDNYLKRAHNCPWYQRLFAVLNSNIKFYKKNPPKSLKKNKSVMRTAFLFEVLTTLSLDLPLYAPEALRENGAKKDPSGDVTLPQWVNIPQRIFHLSECLLAIVMCMHLIPFIAIHPGIGMTVDVAFSFVSGNHRIRLIKLKTDTSLTPNLSEPFSYIATTKTQGSHQKLSKSFKIHNRLNQSLSYCRSLSYAHFDIW